MGRFVVSGTVYHEYSIIVEADTADEAREKAWEKPLFEWFDNGRSGVDIYEVELEDSNG